MKKTKDRISKAIKYLNNISLKEPTNFRIEEIEKDRIVLSYEERDATLWSRRIYKEFNFKKGEITSMKKFSPKLS